MLKTSNKLLLFLLAATTLSSGQTTAKPSSERPIVVVITIDGFPARALNDPRLPMPTLRALAANGATASSMRPVNPTVTWPNHTALITGVDASRHHVMANGLLVFPADGTAPAVEPWVDKDRLVHARTLYDAAAEQGLVTGQVDWVAIYGAKGVNWQFGEKPDVHSPIAQDLIAQGLVSAEQVEHFGKDSSPAWRDQIWTDAAVDILEHHTPDLLLFHLLETDSVQHAYGPLTAGAYAAYADADHNVSRIVEAARAAGVLDRTTFFLLSDHGFASYTHTLSPNAGLLQLGLLHQQDGKYSGPVWVKAEGGAAQLFIRDPKLRAELLPRLISYFRQQPGIAHVYTNEEARALGLPSDGETDQAPQLYLTALPDYAFSDDVAGPYVATHSARGQHGYENTVSDMGALFVASGAAIKAGVSLGAISNLEVAPTIAEILHLKLPAAELPPLKKIFR